MANRNVWVFTAARSSPSDTTPTFPGGVFSSLDLAEAWIKQHALTGIVTLYRMDVGAFDFAGKREVAQLRPAPLGRGIRALLCLAEGL